MSNTDTAEDIYGRLADALEALPHGFARTPSGVEIRLIKKAFTEEEVRLAGQLTRFPETAPEIAKRVGRDVVEVIALLESLVPLGLVSLNSPAGTAGGGILDQTVHGEKKYRLRPFLVGWYEASMRRLDKEFAEPRRARCCTRARLALARANGGDGASSRYRCPLRAARTLSRDRLRM